MQKNKSAPIINYLISYALAALIGLAAFIAVLSVLSLINLKNPIFDAHEFIAQIISVIIASAITGIVCGRVKNKAIINGCVSGVFLSLFIIILITIISSGKFNLKELIIIALCIGVSAASSVVKTNFLKPKRRRK